MRVRKKLGEKSGIFVTFLTIDTSQTSKAGDLGFGRQDPPSVYPVCGDRNGDVRRGVVVPHIHTRGFFFHTLMWRYYWPWLQFQNGARGLRSEIVFTLKQNALSIFEINDIEVNKCLHTGSRDESKQLEGLRDNNSFLFASPGDLPGVDKIGCYYHSRCIARVSLSIFLALQN